jgi:hypothetical protein
MFGMSRRGTVTVAALLAGLALVATLPVPCACLPEPVKVEDHGCCAPAAGWRTADPGCCTAAAEPAPDTPATHARVAPAVVPPLVAVAFVLPSARSIARAPSALARLAPLAAPHRSARLVRPRAASREAAQS